MSTGQEEGWYTDPYGVHEARWMSGGVPTKLVRDGDEESYDDPPDGEWTVTPSPIEAPPAPEGAGGADSLNRRMNEAGQFGATWGAHIPLPNMRDE